MGCLCGVRVVRRRHIFQRIATRAGLSGSEIYLIVGLTLGTIAIALLSWELLRRKHANSGLRPMFQAAHTVPWSVAGAILTGGLGTFVYYRAISHGTHLGHVMSIAYSAPVIGAILAHVLLREHMGRCAWIGTGLVVIGIGLVMWSSVES